MDTQDASNGAGQNFPFPYKDNQMSRGDQLGRQWRIIQHLMASRRGRTVAEIAAALDEHPRSVYRDLEALENAGFPLYTERDGHGNRWRLVEEARRPLPIPLDLTELMALCLSRSLLKGLEGTVFATAMASLSAKLHTLLSPGLKQYLERLETTLAVALPPHKRYGHLQEILDPVHQALMERRWLEMTYFTMHRRQETRRQVAPYRLWYADGALYLIAHCRMRDAVRVFAVDRIRQIRLLDTTFEPPADLDIDAFMGRGMGVFQGPREKVRIRFSARVAGYVAERIWHQTQRLEKTEDGGLIFEAEVAGGTEIVAWVLRWGAEARVLAPQSLLEAVRREAQAMARAYERKDAKPAGTGFETRP